MQFLSCSFWEKKILQPELIRKSFIQNGITVTGRVNPGALHRRLAECMNNIIPEISDDEASGLTDDEEIDDEEEEDDDEEGIVLLTI